MLPELFKNNSTNNNIGNTAERTQNSSTTEDATNGAVNQDALFYYPDQQNTKNEAHSPYLRIYNFEGDALH